MSKKLTIGIFNYIYSKLYIKEIVKERIVCKNGLSFSCQNHFGSYANENHFEIGFPSEKIDLLMPYADNSAEPTDDIYPYVPVKLIIKIINNNGGLGEIKFIK